MCPHILSEHRRKECDPPTGGERDVRPREPKKASQAMSLTRFLFDISMSGSNRVPRSGGSTPTESRAGIYSEHDAVRERQRGPTQSFWFLYSVLGVDRTGYPGSVLTEGWRFGRQTRAQKFTPPAGGEHECRRALARPREPSIDTIRIIMYSVFIMRDIERRQVGNMGRGDMEELREYDTDDGVVTVPSLAEGWRDQGISYEVTDPEPTEKYTSEELTALGIVGVTLLIPKPGSEDSKN
jgi:hypothetical protein